MAPDINSLPPSLYRPISSSTPARRRSAERRAPSISSLSSSHPHSPVLSYRDSLPIGSSTSGPPPDNTGVGAGPGPLRHPRPLTAADLHMQLEKEQEAVVNRLTRELTLLRQQTASVASNTSSTSNAVSETPDAGTGTTTGGHQSSLASLRHRSSSSFSSRSPNTAFPGATNPGSAVANSTSGIAPPRESIAPYTHPRDPLSRQSSVASRRSEASSPSLSSSLIQGDHFPSLYARRYSNSAPQGQHAAAPPNSANTRSPQAPATSRHEDTTSVRTELEVMRRENEELKRRVRELERVIRHQRSESDRSRSMSVSTNASLPHNVPHERPGVAEDDSGRNRDTTG